MIVLGFDNLFEKQPSEQKTVRLELAGVASKFVISGYVLYSAEVKVFTDAGIDVTSTMIEGSETIDVANNYVYTTVKGGTDGSYYYLRLKTTWTKGGVVNQVDEKDLLIKVKQKGS